MAVSWFGARRSSSVPLLSHILPSCFSRSSLSSLLQSTTNTPFPSLPTSYLCAAHTPPLPCCAIDYTVHTLDGSVALLNSTKYFPSRLQVPPTSLRFLPAVARRLYRSFGHAFLCASVCCLCCCEAQLTPYIFSFVSPPSLGLLHLPPSFCHPATTVPSSTLSNPKPPSTNDSSPSTQATI